MRYCLLLLGLFFSQQVFGVKEIKGEFGYRFGSRPATSKLSRVARQPSVGLDKFARIYEFTPKRGKLPGQFKYRLFLSHRSRKLYKLQAYEDFTVKSRCNDAKWNLANFLASRYDSQVETFKVPSISNIRFQIIPLGENNITLDCITAKQPGSQLFIYRLVITYHNHASKKIAEREKPKK